MPRPPVDLTDHLGVLARQTGYNVDLDELDPVTGHEPRLVTTWALSAGRHAALAYARWLLDGPDEFLRAAAADGEHTIAAALLPDLVATELLLDAQLRISAGVFGRACHALAGAGLGLVWPRAAAATPLSPDPREHQRLTDALAAAGFTAEDGTEVSTRTSTGGGRATVTVDGAIRLYVQPETGPDWQATFAMSTPPAAILAAASG